MTIQSTDSQAKAINHNDGNLVVLAVAGSGKTRAMVHRAARLVRENIVSNPAQILMVTFTKKAADNMVDRLRKIDARAGEVDARTFHSFCLRVLREFDDRFRGEKFLLDETNSWLRSVWADRVIKKLQLSRDTKPGDVINAVNSFKARCVHPDHIDDNDVFSNQLTEHEKSVYAVYDQEQRSSGKFDFADLEIYCFDLLRRDKRVRDIIRSAYKQVMVDEYQDTSPVQEMILELIIGCPDPTLPEGAIIPDEPRPSLVVVGDDDQSIYSFRHAVPEFIIEFQKRWDADSIFMEENFRSHSQITTAANRLIGFNQTRVGKVLKPMVGSDGTVVLLAGNEGSHMVISEIRRLRLEEDVNWGDIAVLYRTNAQSCMFESKLTEDGIPYVCVGQKEGFYGMSEVKTLVKYLQLCDNPANMDALRYVWNRPNRYLKRELLINAQSVCGSTASAVDVLIEAEKLAGINHWKVHGLRRAVEKGCKAVEGGSKPYDVLEELIAATDYREWMHRVSETTGKSMADLEQLADRILEDSWSHKTVSEFLDHVRRVVENAKKREVNNAVQLLTLHRSKGLEFPVVFFAGMTSDYIPHPRGDREEERRLTYVGCTRAEKRLYCVTNLTNPSEFITEMGLSMRDAVSYVDDDTVPSLDAFEENPNL